jgi:predicted cobalt transporter CbtA
MKTMTFLAITLLSGAIAGALLAIINQFAVEPFIEKAIFLENQKAAAKGEVIDPVAFASYRVWQKDGEILAGTVLGMSYCSLVGVVFAYSRPHLPGSNNKKKALILAGIMWFVIFFMVAVKYPANPPAVGSPATIYYRQSLYVGYLAISGFGALGLAVLYRKLGQKQSKKMIVPALYAALMLCAYFAMPSNPDPITAPMDLVTSFRTVSAFTMSIFWELMGFFLGMFWDKTKPHETAKRYLLHK